MQMNAAAEAVADTVQDTLAMGEAYAKLHLHGFAVINVFQTDFIQGSFFDRALNEDAVDELMKSFQKVGIQDARFPVAILCSLADIEYKEGTLSTTSTRDAPIVRFREQKDRSKNVECISGQHRIVALRKHVTALDREIHAMQKDNMDTGALEELLRHQQYWVAALYDRGMSAMASISLEPVSLTSVQTSF